MSLYETYLPDPSHSFPVFHHPGTALHLAQIYGLSMEEIVELNQLADGGHWIFPGQMLVIRDAGCVALAAAVSSDSQRPWLVMLYICTYIE